MNNKKAFTLIELLAIIVILSVIFAITIPIMLNIIKNAKTGAIKDSVFGYKDAINKYYLKKIATDPTFKFENKTYTIDSNGYLKYTDTSNYENNITYEISISGQIPSAGTVELENNKIKKACIKFDDYVVSISNNIIGNVIKGNCNGTTAVVATNIPSPVSFETDSWATIKQAIDDDNTSAYSVGDTKEVEIDGTSYTIRLANKTFDGCNTEANGFSQSACGFVFEFADIIETRGINLTDTNVGGWPASAIYDYLNDESSSEITSLYEKLPSDLRNIIVPTYTVSGHGSTDGETNFTSTDKIYLLSRQEVLGDNLSWDTANNKTKQLEYYQNNNAIKYTVGQTPVATAWWLRSAVSYMEYYFYYIGNDGTGSYDNANANIGIAPAFRIVKETE